MTTSREDAARLVQDVRTTELVFLGGHVYHFRPDYQAMAAAYRNGEIGEVWLAEGDYISDMRPFYGPSSYTPWRTEGGAPIRDRSRCSSGPGGGSASPPAITSTRQVEQRPLPPQTEACGMPPQRLASSTL